MKKILLKKKLGFIAKNAPVTVFDKRGHLFYQAKEGKKFNLPAGVYYIKGKVKVTKPLDFSKYIIVLPPEKNIPFLGIKKVFFVNNPNKCSIDVSKGHLFVDKNFWNNLNYLQKRFVLLHELGHYFYFNEKKCDNYARCIMLLEGVNPSQIFNVTKSTLVTCERINNMKLKLLKK